MTDEPTIGPYELIKTKWRTTVRYHYLPYEGRELPAEAVISIDAGQDNYTTAVEFLEEAVDALNEHAAVRRTMRKLKEARRLEAEKKE